VQVERGLQILSQRGILEGFVLENAAEYMRNRMFKLDSPLCTCGYGTSAVYSKPVSTLRYMR
jgi:hypothetical protein